jgi:hypothetical protein
MEIARENSNQNTKIINKIFYLFIAPHQTELSIEMS